MSHKGARGGGSWIIDAGQFARLGAGFGGGSVLIEALFMPEPDPIAVSPALLLFLGGLFLAAMSGRIRTEIALSSRK